MAAGLESISFQSSMWNVSTQTNCNDQSVGQVVYLWHVRKSAEHIQISVLPWQPFVCHHPAWGPVCRPSGRLPARSVVSPVTGGLQLQDIRCETVQSYAELRRRYWRCSGSHLGHDSSLTLLIWNCSRPYDLPCLTSHTPTRHWSPVCSSSFCFWHVLPYK
jgi:hypothetical protein